MACYILQIRAGARATVGNIKQKRRFFASGMSLEDKCAPTSVLFICIGFSLPLCPLDLSRKGHKSSTTNWALLSRRDGTSVWCSTRSWVRELHPVFVQIKACRPLVSCRQQYHDIMLPTSPAALCGPRLLPKVSLYKRPSIASSCTTPRYSTTTMVPFSCSSLTLP